MSSTTRTTKEQINQLQEMGYVQIWVQNLTEGMYIAPEIWETATTKARIFGVVNDLHTDVTYEKDANGQAIEDSRRIGVRFFLTEDDGTAHSMQFGQTKSLWMNPEKSETPN